MTQSKGPARSRDEWTGVLAAALLWLRNHYEVACLVAEAQGLGPKSLEDRRAVLARVDAVLHDNQPTGVDMDTFREWYPPNG